MTIWKKIGFKFWAAMMFLVGLVMLLLWLFQIVFLERFYNGIVKNQILHQGREILSGLEDLDQINMKKLEDFGYQRKVNITLVGSHGEVLYEQVMEKESPGIIKSKRGEILSEVMLGKEKVLETEHPKFHSRFIVGAVPLISQGEVRGAMLMEFSMLPVEDTAFILKKQLLIIVVILLVIAVILSYFLARKFTRPILEIHSVADSYSKGKYETRVTVASEDEIGNLALRMNQMGEQLEKNMKFQKELIANVSHELRTPLTLIQGYGETLRDVTGKDPEKREKQLSVIIEEAKRLGIMVEDMLNLSQLQGGVVKVKIGEFSLSELVKKTLELLEVKIEGRNLVVIQQEDKTISSVMGDTGRIQQVLYNLINNALHHTKKEDSIEISLLEKEKVVRVEIKDSGPGIEKEDLEHIFERYYQGKKVDGKKEEGIGLGLAIVKSILDIHKTAYGVKSILGQGTTFWFELPKGNSHTSF